MKVHLRLRYEMNRQLRTTGELSLPDYDVLVALISDERGTLSISDLATRIGWERSRASHHVRRMAARGLVGTEQSESDRRSTQVSLTARGRATLGNSSPGHVELVRAVFLDPLDERRRSELAESLERIYDALIEHGSLPRPVDHP
ncbi:winged helix-turn-helix transcriptional regulator [Naasia lichenicola]|uniref:Winged helix-turn-helix transcriptional regulator n=2 Tax=Naasia lichenicola TaxID=2565933 RepID=A0A4V3WT14_9MICO|nr:winged helix-turn-helix transcriptional regulator [Naasia lichenicola]